MHYKDLRICTQCKTYWKGRRLTDRDALALFSLSLEDIQDLPHKRANHDDSVSSVNLYAFATIAGKAVSKYGSLYNLVVSTPDERASTAQRIQYERSISVPNSVSS